MKFFYPNMVSLHLTRLNEPVLFFLLLFFLLNPAWAQPEYQSYQINTGGGQGASVSSPVNLAVGDLMILSIMATQNPTITLNGWENIISITNSGNNNVSIAVFYKIATLSDVGTSFIGVGLNGNPSWNISVTRITDFNPDDPINVSGGINGTNNTTSLAAPSVITTTDSTLVLAFYSNNTQGIYTPPAGTTERFDVPHPSNNRGPSHMMATYVHANAGATGQKTAIATQGSNNWIAVQVAINPASVSLPGIFRSRQSGAWDDSDTWEQDDGNGGWVNTAAYPINGHQSTIMPSHIVTVSSVVQTRILSISEGGLLVVAESGAIDLTELLGNPAGVQGLRVASSAAGTGSLIYRGAVAGTFQRYVGSTNAWQMLSSPVAGQSISGDFTPEGTYADNTGYDFYAWSEPATAWVYLLNDHTSPTWSEVNGGNTFGVGRGYLVSYQQSDTKAFSGDFNHGTVSIGISRTETGDSTQYWGTNLVGNPYPSSIDWNAPSGWTRDALENSGGGYDVWIWHDSSKNYGVYNSALNNVHTGTLNGSRYIAPTQGFFVRAGGLGTTFSMTDDVRVHQESGNWIKSGQQAGATNPEVLLLRIESPENSGIDEVMLVFGHQTEKGAQKMFSFLETAPSLYLPKQRKNYSIRMLHSPESNPLVPLSFIAGVEGEYRLKAQFPDLLSEMIVLQDLQSGERHDFRQSGDYVFYASPGDPADRFVLRFSEGRYADPFQVLPAWAYTHGREMEVDLRLVDPDVLCLVQVFDPMGRMVYEESMPGSFRHRVNLDRLRGVYVVRISARQGGSYSGKLLFF